MIDLDFFYLEVAASCKELLGLWADALVWGLVRVAEVWIGIGVGEAAWVEANVMSSSKFCQIIITVITNRVLFLSLLELSLNLVIQLKEISWRVFAPSTLWFLKWNLPVSAEGFTLSGFYKYEYVSFAVYLVPVCIRFISINGGLVQKLKVLWLQQFSMAIAEKF